MTVFKALILLIGWLFVNPVMGQSPYDLTIDLRYGGQPLLLKDSQTTYQKQPLVFTKLMFYLSDLKLLQSGKVVWEQRNSHHLVIAGNTESIKIDLGTSESLVFDALQFSIGTDSITNTSGAMAGDLDPTKGMFWTWNSGYINFKLEGSHPLSPNRKNGFQFHIGGYRYPYPTIRTLTVPAGSVGTRLVLDLAPFLNSIDLEKQNRIMSPGPDATELADLLAKMFSSEKID